MAVKKVITQEQKKLQKMQRLIKKAQKICNFYATGEHSVAQAAKKGGVSPRTFYNWMEQFPEVFNLYTKAKETKELIYSDVVREDVMTSYQKLVRGYEYTEIKNEGVSVPVTNEEGVITGYEFRVTKSIQTTKHVPPNAASVLFGMVNLLDNNFKHVNRGGGGRANDEPTGDRRNGKPIPYAGFKFVIADNANREE